MFSRFFVPTKILFSALFLLMILFSSANIAHGLDLSFAWDAHTYPDLAGYRVFFRQEGQNYDYNNPVWDGTETTCTIFGLDDNFIYHFVSRVYDINGNESGNSIELCYGPESIDCNNGTQVRRNSLPFLILLLD